MRISACHLRKPLPGIAGISERTKAGLQRAVKAGKTLGRRAVAVDVAQAHRLQGEGMGLRPIAKQLHVSVNTLARALRE